LVLLLSGVAFFPGGHKQFALWYIHLVPLAVSMIKIPGWVGAALFYFVFEVNLEQYELSHMFLLALVAVMIVTVGPANCKPNNQNATVVKQKDKKE